MGGGGRGAGLIVASVQPQRAPDVFASLRDSQIPFVLVDGFFPKGNFTSVRVDDKAGGRLATQAPSDLGHTRIAHIQVLAVSPGSRRSPVLLAALISPGT